MVGGGGAALPARPFVAVQAHLAAVEQGVGLPARRQFAAQFQAEQPAFVARAFVDGIGAYPAGAAEDEFFRGIEVAAGELGAEGGGQDEVGGQPLQARQAGGKPGIASVGVRAGLIGGEVGGVAAQVEAPGGQADFRLGEAAPAQAVAAVAAGFQRQRGGAAAVQGGAEAVVGVAAGFRHAAELEVGGLRAQPGISQAEAEDVGAATGVESGEIVAQAVAHARNVGAQAQAVVIQRNAVVEAQHFAAARNQRAHPQLVAATARAVKAQPGGKLCHAGGGDAVVGQRGVAREQRGILDFQAQAGFADGFSGFQHAPGGDAGQIVGEQQGTFQAVGAQRFANGLGARHHAAHEFAVTAAAAAAAGGFHVDAAEAAFDDGDFDHAVADFLRRQVDAGEPAARAVVFGDALGGALQVGQREGLSHQVGQQRVQFGLWHQRRASDLEGMHGDAGALVRRLHRRCWCCRQGGPRQVEHTTTLAFALQRAGIGRGLGVGRDIQQ